MPRLFHEYYLRSAQLEADSCKLYNQARFIRKKCDGTLTIENMKKKTIVDKLRRKGFGSDPIKAWKREQATSHDVSREGEDEEEEYEVQEDYDYLLDMKMWALTKEKRKKLLRHRDEKKQELQKLKKLRIIYQDAFLTIVEQGRLYDAGRNILYMKTVTMPSPMGIRVEHRIADDLKVKTAKAAAAKANKGDVKKTDVKKEIEFDLMLFKSMNVIKLLGDRMECKNPWSFDEEDKVSNIVCLSDAMDDERAAAQVEPSSLGDSGSDSDF